MGVSHLYRHLLPLILSTVHLTHWARSYRFFFKIFKNVFDIFTIGVLKIFFSRFEWMCGCIFSKVLKLIGQFWSNYISPVAEILEGLDEDNSSALHRLHEEIPPVVLRSFKEQEREEQDGWCEYDQQMKKSDDVDDGPPNFLPNRTTGRFHLPFSWRSLTGWLTLQLYISG